MVSFNVDYAALGNKKIDCKGKLKTILNKIHADFKSAYGEDLFICADRAFQDCDKEVDESVVESLNDWFIAAEQAPPVVPGRYVPSMEKL